LLSPRSAAELIFHSTQRIPPPSTPESDDPVIALADGANAASLLVAELAAVSTALSGRSAVRFFSFPQSDEALTAKLDAPQTLSAGILVKIVQGSAAIPLADAVALHQLASWPANNLDCASPLSCLSSAHRFGELTFSSSVAKPAAVFATLLHWAEHLARGATKVKS
jgi:hypothetical protein